MSWRKTCIMDERMKFIADCLRRELPMAALCEQYGISRKTGYKWLGRYREDPEEGLSDRSRALSPQELHPDHAEEQQGQDDDERRPHEHRRAI